MAQALVEAPRIDGDSLRCLLNDIGRILADEGVLAEVAIYGGAALQLTLDNRPLTADVDFTLIEGDREVLERAANTVGRKYGMPPGWFNDAVNMFISRAPELTCYGDFPACTKETGLRVFVARPEYILAMKSLSMRSSLESHDVKDIWNLVDECEVTDISQIEETIRKFFPGEEWPERNRLIMKDILADKQGKLEYDPMRYW